MTTTTTTRVGDWMTTASGKRVYPLDPDPADFDLSDIALPLSNLCRFAGHTRIFHSVASHALLVSQLVAPLHPGLALAALHHDDAEAFISDIPRPVKRHLVMVWGRLGQNAEGLQTDTRNEDYIGNVETRMLRCIFQALGVPWPDEDGWNIIHRADDAVLRAEAEQLLTDADWARKLPEPPDFLRISTTPLHNREVASVFITQHHLLLGRLAA